MSLEPLPPRIAHARIPRLLSPSRAADLERCALSVLVDASTLDLLPPAPVAALGTVLHHAVAEVCAGRWGAETSARSAFDRAVAEASQRIEQHLSERGWGGLVSLRDAVGIALWQRRCGRAWRWVQAEQPEGGSMAPRPLVLWPAAPASEDLADGVGTGPEALVVWKAGRVRGRADRIVVLPDGTRRVMEYKTGAVRDADGCLLDDIGLQAGIYALAVEAVSGTKVDVQIVGAETVALPWDAALRRRYSERLATIHTRLPAGEQRVATDLATPGPHCTRCLIRPACGAYLDGAPALWTRPGVGAGMPLDVWGRAERLSTIGGRSRLEIVDDAGLWVVVDGLDPSRRLDEIAPGSRVYLFGLERAEAHVHAERVRPTNLREHHMRAEAVSGPAPGVRVFAGG